MNVDWRNRWGWNWVTSARDQGGSVNCWAFAMTALYEAMVRIEHCVWCRRSEGDLARATGKQSWDFGNLGEASIAAERFGVADPDCFPWSEAAALYTAKPHGVDMSALPLSPTPDRRGRTVRIDANRHTSISNDAQKKQWIDLVGPMAVMFAPPGDLNALGSGIYTTTGSGAAHALLVVGFNDDDACWIVKNSWGPGWGVGGFGRIAYSANQLEPYAFVGVRNTNPDAWTKRRNRNGVLVESGNGARHNNFELFLRVGLNLEHWWREHAVAGFPWNRVGLVQSADPWRATWRDDALDCPAVVQSTFNRNYELVYRARWSPTEPSRLRHVYFDQASGWWYDATVFGPANPVGIPGLVQSTRGAPGDLEVVVLTPSGMLEHWTKHNSYPWTQRPGTWRWRQSFGWGVVHAGPALVQSRLGSPGELEDGLGELHYVATGSGGTMLHFRRSVAGVWSLIGTFGAGITSAPCMIEGQFNAGHESDVGNFELCVAANGQIEHWWRNNHGPAAWQRSAVFGNGVRRVLSLLQGSFGFNLEVIVERTDGRYQHYWRDSAGWHTGVVIV